MLVPYCRIWQTNGPECQIEIMGTAVEEYRLKAGDPLAKSLENSKNMRPKSRCKTGMRKDEK
jgi:hypothetical protein